MKLNARLKPRSHMGAENAAILFAALLPESCKPSDTRPGSFGAVDMSWPGGTDSSLTIRFTPNGHILAFGAMYGLEWSSYTVTPESAARLVRAHCERRDREQEQAHEAESAVVWWSVAVAIALLCCAVAWSVLS